MQRLHHSRHLLSILSRLSTSTTSDAIFTNSAATSAAISATFAATPAAISTTSAAATPAAAAISTTSAASSPPPPSSTTPPRPLILPRTRTPSETQFESWITNLKPGFSASDVDSALRSQSDADLAFDIFRWTAQQRNYKHNHQTYLTMIQISVSGKRYSVAETLVEEVLSGACPIDISLCNSMIKFCCGRKFLSTRAFDVYKKMMKSEDSKPNLETYALLFNSLLRKFGRLPVSYVYLHAVRSLRNQMKACGVIPDSFVLNLIIKAYCKCLEVDEAMRVFREMGLYGCEPNAYTYNYIIRAMAEKGMVSRGLELFKEMKEKCLEGKPSTCMVLVCSLAMERRFEDSIEVMFDMLGNSISPDFLTYKTLLEEMCRDGRGDEAFDLVEQFRKRDSFMNEKTYSSLLNSLHFLSRQ